MINPFVVILPSAGSGSRFSSEIPKQYQKINGKLVLDYSVQVFLSIKECKKIVIAISDSDKFHLDLKQDSRIDIIQGGLSRAESVRIAFKHLVSSGFTDDVLIHDAARPCLELSQVKHFLQRFFSADHSGMIFAKPSANTLKTSFNGQTISTTIDRSEIWEAETPQIFNFKKLYNAYDLYKNDISLLTDESSLFDELDDQIVFYETTSKNIKITYKEDLKLAEYLLRTIED